MERGSGIWASGSEDLALKSYFLSQGAHVSPGLGVTWECFFSSPGHVTQMKAFGGFPPGAHCLCSGSVQTNAPSSAISICQAGLRDTPEWLPAISQAGQLRRGRGPPQPRLTFLWRRRNVREVSKLPVLPAREHEEEKKTPQPAAYLP